MNRQELLDYIKATYNIDADYPFKETFAVVRYPHNKKWFGIIMQVGTERLGLKCDKAIDIINIKCDPMMCASMWNGKTIFPAYHMNKTHWLSIDIENVEENELKILFDMSFVLTSK